MRRNIVGKQLPTFLDITCCFRLHTLQHVVACCWESLCKVFETGLTFAPSNISFVPWSPKLVQQCWIRLHRSSNIVGATCAPRWLSNSSLQSLKLRANGRNNSQNCRGLLANNVACFSTGLYGLYLTMHCSLNIVGSCCIHLHSISNTDTATNPQHCWPNNVGSCCFRLHVA